MSACNSCVLFLNFQNYVTVDCHTLQKGQYLCTNLDIDEETQQPRFCDRDNQKAPITCIAAPQIICEYVGFL